MCNRNSVRHCSIKSAKILESWFFAIEYFTDKKLYCLLEILLFYRDGTPKSLLRGSGKCLLSTLCQVVQLESSRTFSNSKNVSGQLQFRQEPTCLNWGRLFLEKKIHPEGTTVNADLGLGISTLEFVLLRVF